MFSKGRVYLIIALFTIGLLLVIEYNKPRDLNWYPSFVSTHSIPYGTLVFNDIIKNKYSDQVFDIKPSPYDFLTAHADVKGSYLFADRKVEFGDQEINRLLRWVGRGNQLVVASNSFEDYLLDTLQVQTARIYGQIDQLTTHYHELVHPKLARSDPYIFDKNDHEQYFNEFNPNQWRILGTISNAKKINGKYDIGSKPVANIISRKFGKGEVILSTFPEAFTNYFILKDENSTYTSGVLSYIEPFMPVYVDAYHKSGKSQYTSPMHLFLSQPALKWGYYIALIGVLLYIIFEGKRKQRAIEVIRPLQNQTLAFTRTIADLYYKKQDAKSISEYQINNFLQYLKVHFYLGDIAREEDFYNNLASRSHHTTKEIKRLFNLIEQFRNATIVSAHELKILNASIEKFKNKAQTKPSKRLKPATTF